MAGKKKLTFEEQMQQVEALLTRMEEGGQPLEESLKDYEAGLKMIVAMEKELEGMKQRVTVLAQGEELPLKEET